MPKYLGKSVVLKKPYRHTDIEFNTGIFGRWLYRTALLGRRSYSQMKFASISFSLDLGSCAEATIAFISLINSILTLVLTFKRICGTIC